jgi:hypothetical protein
MTRLTTYLFSLPDWLGYAHVVAFTAALVAGHSVLFT